MSEKFERAAGIVIEGLLSKGKLRSVEAILSELDSEERKNVLDGALACAFEEMNSRSVKSLSEMGTKITPSVMKILRQKDLRKENPIPFIKELLAAGISWRMLNKVEGMEKRYPTLIESYLTEGQKNICVDLADLGFEKPNLNKNEALLEGVAIRSYRSDPCAECLEFLMDWGWEPPIWYTSKYRYPSSSKASLLSDHFLSTDFTRNVEILEVLSRRKWFERNVERFDGKELTSFLEKSGMTYEKEMLKVFVVLIKNGVALGSQITASNLDEKKETKLREILALAEKEVLIEDGQGEPKKRSVRRKI